MPEYLIKVGAGEYRFVFPFVVPEEEMLKALREATIAPPKPVPTEAEKRAEIEQQAARAAKWRSEQFEKAKKITIHEWDNPIWSPDDRGYQDGYFPDIDSYLEHCEDEGEDPEPWIWATKAHALPDLNADWVAEHALEDMYEDAGDDLVGLEELDQALKAFFKKNAAIRTFTVDYSIAIVLEVEQQ